jgi:hypothetical protein
LTAFACLDAVCRRHRGAAAEEVLRAIADDPARDPIERGRAKLGLELEDRRKAAAVAAEERRKAAAPASRGHVVLLVSGTFFTARTTARLMEALDVVSGKLAGATPALTADDGVNVDVDGVFRHVSAP